METKAIGGLNIFEKEHIFDELIQKELDQFGDQFEALGISRDVIEKMLRELRRAGSDVSKRTRICTVVYETMDYDRFKFIDGNRDINKTNKKNIIESFGEQGQRYVTNPIIVNEKMEIIDGQHRFEASRELGMPIQYIIVEGIGREAVQDLNRAQLKWALSNFVGFHRVTDESFERLFDLLKLYNDVPGKAKLSTTVIYAAVFKRPASSANQAITAAATEGHLNFSERDYEFVRKYLNPIQKIKEKDYACLRGIEHSDKLLNAIYRLMSVDGCGSNRFISGLERIRDEKVKVNIETRSFEDCLKTAYNIYKAGLGRCKKLTEEDLARINKECHPVTRRVKDRT